MVDNIINEELAILQILEIDLFIFDMLKTEFENKNVDFINIKQLLEEKHSDKLPYSSDIIEKRIFWAIGIGFIDLESLPEDINEFIKLMDERDINPQDFIYTKGKKHLIDHQKYYQEYLNIKINSEGLKHIEELKKQIKLEKRNKFLIYRILNKINGYTEDFLKYKRTIGIILTILIAIFSWTFGPKMMNKLENISFMTSILNLMDVGNDKDDSNNNYINININKQRNDELRNRINEFVKDNFKKDNVNNIEINNISENRKKFTVYLKNSQPKTFEINKDSSGKIDIKPADDKRDFLEIKNIIPEVQKTILKF